jgi:hypothetical protein
MARSIIKLKSDAKFKHRDLSDVQPSSNGSVDLARLGAVA